MRRIAITLAWVGCVSGAGFGQAGAGAGSQTSTLSSGATLVVVPALVRTKAGELVFTLKADDFALTDDGVPQKLRLEENTGGEPLVLVVLIEAGAALKSAGWHPDTLDEAPDRFRTLATMVGAMAGDVPRRIAVVGFDSQPVVLQDFTGDMEQVTDAIHEVRGDEGDGGAAILDSLAYSVEMLKKQPPGYRRAILLLSETNDRGSEAKLDEALRAVADTNTVIYSIAYSTGNTRASEYGHRVLPTKAVPCRQDEGDLCAWLRKMEDSHNKAVKISGTAMSALIYGIGLTNPTPGPASGCMGDDDTNPGQSKNKAVRAFDCLGQLVPPLALAKMAAIAASEDMQRNVPETVAQLTGGEYFKLTDANSMEKSLQAISNHLPNRYVLSFEPQGPHAGLHVLALGVPGYANLKVDARASYWADSPAAATGK